MITVSIIMPYYNAAKYIFETVDSIINQSYRDWELIIIDDCSPAPETVEVLKKVAALDCRIRVLKAETNGGAGATRNIGIKAAQGRFIAFCDSDDWWYPTKLEEQLKFMLDNDYEFTCTWYEDANAELEPYYVMKQAPKNNYNSLIAGCNIGTPGVMFDTRRIGKRYMPNLRRAEDWGLWQIILRDVDYLYTYPKALWKYRHVQGSETSDKWKQMKAVIKMYREVLGFSLVKANLFGYFVFLPNNIWKKVRKKL